MQGLISFYVNSSPHLLRQIWEERFILLQSQHTSISPCKGPFLVLLYHIFPQILTPIPQLSALNHTYSNIYYFVYVEVLKSHIVSCYRTQTFSLLNSVLILTLYSCHSILWVHCVWMLQNISEYAFHPILCICSSGDGHLSCLQLPATTTLSVPQWVSLYICPAPQNGCSNPHFNQQGLSVPIYSNPSYHFIFIPMFYFLPI